MTGTDHAARRGRDTRVAAAAEGATERLWEVDLARTAAIAMMVVYHVGYDLDLLGPGVPIDPFGGGWRALQVACGSTFLFVVGVSLWISGARSRARGLTVPARYRRHARRAAEVLAAALLVSVVTRIALGSDDYIRFGILHCIGVTMLILPLLIGLGPVPNLVLGVGAVVAGRALAGGAGSDAAGLLVFGVPRASGSEGVDWYPLLPWIGPALIGLAAGAVLYPGGSRGAWGRGLRAPRHARQLGFPGRHALPIYLVHQVVLIALVALALTLAGAEVTLDGI